MAAYREIRVLLVDHELHTARRIAVYLERQGFSVTIDAAHDQLEVRPTTASSSTGAGRGRLGVWRAVRDRCGIAVLTVITRREAVDALAIGPDYIMTPFAVSERALRILVAIWRARGATPTERSYT